MLQQYSTNAFVQARAVQLEAVLAKAGTKKGAIARIAQTVNLLLGRNPGTKQMHRDTSVLCLREICTNACDSPWPVAFAVEMMTAAGWRRIVEKVLSESLYVDGAHEEVGRQWVRLRIARGHWNCGRRLRALADQRGRIGVEAAVTFIDTLIHNKRKARFRRFLWWNKDWLRKYGRTWGKVAYAMACFGWPARRCIRWMDDWRRKDAESWMLANLVEWLRIVGRDVDAAEVSRHALRLPAVDSGDVHRAWLAADAACHGELDVARQLLAELHQPPPTDGIAFIEKLATAVVEMALAKATDKSNAFCTARQRLREAIAHYKPYSRDPARRRLYRKCLRLIAQYEGGFEAKAWYWWRWLVSS